MYILSVDTCDQEGELALGYLESHELSWRHVERWQRDKSHSELITDVFSKMMAKAQIGISDIKSLILVNGPGSFTGVRVGFNFSRALGFLHSIQLMTVDGLTLEIVPFLKRPGHYFVLKKAFRDLVYVKEIVISDSLSVSAQFEPTSRTFGQVLQTADPLRHTFIVENIDVDFEKSLQNKMPETRYHQRKNSPSTHLKVAHLITSKSPLLMPTDWKSLSPLYIRDSEPEEKLKPRL